MLIIKRKEGQSIVINDNIEIFIEKIKTRNVKISISAPDEVRIRRKEVLEATEVNIESVEENIETSCINDIINRDKHNIFDNE